MTKPVVLIVGGDPALEYIFGKRGWRTLITVKNSQDVEQLDLVCFTGGADINPNFYGEKKLSKTFTNPPRDEYEKKVFDILRTYDIPMVGVCRGGQLLNVFSGGKLWQDVDNHQGNHKAVDIVSGREVELTSTHHQMMRPTKEAKILCVAHKSTRRETENYVDVTQPYDDPEVVYYESTKSLCFQAHPEYGLKACTQYFFDLIADEFSLKGHAE